MIDLHRNLVSCGTGRKIVGAIGIVLFVLSATGMLMWLTGARNWRAWTRSERAVPLCASITSCTARPDCGLTPS
jgi:uncharacterized iron-regulated membrane protein